MTLFSDRPAIRKYLESENLSRKAGMGVRVNGCVYMAETEVRSCVRGYHVYKDIWTTAIGETLICSREPSNTSDRYAVAVIKSGTVIGHLPRKISKVCCVLIRMHARSLI